MAMGQMQSGLVTLGQGHFRSHNVTSVCLFLAYNFLQKRDAALRMVSLCSVGRDTSINRYIDLVRSPVELKVANLRSPEVN